MNRGEEGELFLKADTRSREICIMMRVIYMF